MYYLKESLMNFFTRNIYYEISECTMMAEHSVIYKNLLSRVGEKNHPYCAGLRERTISFPSRHKRNFTLC